MGLSSKPILLLSATLPFLLNFGLILASSISIPNHTNLVYKNCANHTHTDPTLLSSLLQELVEHSSNSKFYETYIGDDTTAISALFQCRFYLTNNECHNCITTLVDKTSTSWCAGPSFPTRVELSGCYLRCEPENDVGNILIQRDLVQHNSCGEMKAWFSGFKDLRAQAFREVSGCVMGSGFCEMRYEGMHVMGQCEGNLGECECGECVTNALQVAEDECGDSVSGKIYLENCFVEYSYESNGGKGESHSGGGNNSKKLVAIVAGGAVALGLGLVLWSFIKSSRKKSDDW